MSKNVAAQIRESERKKFQKQFETKYKYLIDDLENERTLRTKAINEANKIRQVNAQLREENELLKNKVEQYEDWIQRLQEFMDLGEAESKEAFKQYLTKIKEDQSIRNAMKGYATMIDKVFNIMF